jgi:TonB-dependent starch-binding outer membrane protein SusC
LNRVAEGESIGYFYGVAFAGADPNNGDALFYVDETRTETTNDYSKAKQQKVGNPNPDFTGGLINTFGYKNFDLNVVTQFVSGNDIFNVAGYFQSVSGDYFDNQTRDQLNAWKKPGDITMVPQARLYGANGAQASSRWLQDGSFFRVKTISLGYNLPKNLVQKIYLQSARIYFAAQNPILFTKYQGYDPEVNTFYSATSTQNANIFLGSDFYTPPQQKTFSVGLNLGF